MRLTIVNCLFLFLLLSVLPVARAQFFVDNESRQLSAENSQRLENITAVVRELNEHITTLTNQNNRLRKQLTEFSQQKQQLEQLVRETTGKLEEIQQQGGGNQDKFQKTLKHLSGKLTRLSGDVANLNEKMGILEQRFPPPAEGEMYASAFALLQEKQYEEAIKGFSAILHLYPEGQFNINARYWISNAYLSLQRYAEAQQNAEKLITDYPQNDKESDTLLIIAKASRGLDNTARSNEILTKLLELYPTSLAADEARQLLAAQ